MTMITLMIQSHHTAATNKKALYTQNGEQSVRFTGNGNALQSLLATRGLMLIVTHTIFADKFTNIN